MQIKRIRFVYGVLWIIGCSVIFTTTLLSPFVYRRAICSTENALDYLVGETLWKCRERCERMAQCNTINYNLYSKMCVLQDEGATETSKGSLCVSLEVNVQSTSLEGPCDSRPCVNSTVCVTLYNHQYACKPIFCPSPPSIQHASLMSDTPTYIGSRTSYRCEHGYTGFPNPVIECLSNRTWTSTDFVCYPNCPSIPVTASAVLVSWSPNRLFANTTVHYQCKPDFYNLTETVIVCDNNGSWSHLGVNCFKYCLVPENPTHGKITELPAGPYVNDSTALFSCNSGYYHYPTGQLTKAVCGSDGDWNYLAECYKECGSDSPSADIWENGRKLLYISPPHRPYTVITFAKYECHSGRYWSPSTKDKSTCDRYGNWDEPAYCCLNGVAKYNPDKGYCTLFGL